MQANPQDDDMPDEIDFSKGTRGKFFTPSAMAHTEQVLIEKIRGLPPQRISEVEDFVDFLRAREGEQRLTHTASRASEPSFAQVWDNDEDSAYDRI